MGKKVKSFDIQFSNPKGVYQSGEMVEGYVQIEVHNEIKIRGIRILLHGSAFVHWTERHTSGSGKNRRTVTKAFTAGETYFNQTQVLFGKAEGEEGEDPVLKPGLLKYPFKVQLPPGLPASLESNLYGRVRYWAKAYIDRPWRFDKTTKKPFTVIGQTDCNTELLAFQPQSGQAQKTLCCMCCESGPIAAILRLEKTAFVPGEDLKPNGEVINHSNRTMASSKLEIQQTTYQISLVPVALALISRYLGRHGDGANPPYVRDAQVHDAWERGWYQMSYFSMPPEILTFHAKTKSRRTTRSVAELKQGEIKPGETAVWTGMVLKLPPVPPSGLAGCRIIDIDYKIKLVVNPAGPAFDLEVPLSLLVVTTPPCTSRPQTSSSQSQYQRNGSRRPVSTEPPPQINWYKNVPPPTYAECNFGKVDIHDEDDNDFTMGVMRFAPCYIYYNFPDRNMHNSSSRSSIQRY